MMRVLLPAPGVIADLGCGTGSLSLLAADLGHSVWGEPVSDERYVVVAIPAEAIL